MAATREPNLGILFGWSERESGWGDDMNANLLLLATMVQPWVHPGANDPPTGYLGFRGIVGSSPTGAWAGHANNIAYHDGSDWHFYQPQWGCMVWIRMGSDPNYTLALKYWTGSVWGQVFP